MDTTNLVKFKAITEQDYNDIPNKDPNALYFTEDSQRLYKGETCYADGSITGDKVLHVYELSEEEFWNQYSSGNITNGLCTYTGVTLASTEFSANIPLSTSSLVLEHDDKCYIASYIDNKSVLSVINKDGDILETHNLADMLATTTTYSPAFIGNWQGYSGITRRFIGIDDQGYLYINGIHKSEAYSYGVIAIDTADMSNPAAWNWVADINSHVAFAPVDLYTSSTYTAEFAVPRYLKTADGGIFGIKSNIHSQPFNDLSPINNAEFAYYFKSGSCVCQSYGFSGGAQNWAVDYASNKLYSLSYGAVPSGYGICITEMGIDGTRNTYQLASEPGEFANMETRSASFVYYAAGKVFAHISNSTQRQIVLDSSTGEYTLVNVQPTQYNVTGTRISNICDTGTSIAYVVDRSDLLGVRSTMLISWDYVHNQIHCTNLQDLSESGSYYCNYIRTDNHNNIVIDTIDKNNSTIVQGISLDTHELQYSFKLDSNRSFYYMSQLPDDTLVGQSYGGSNSGLIFITSEGDVKYIPSDIIVHPEYLGPAVVYDSGYVVCPYMSGGTDLIYKSTNLSKGSLVSCPVRYAPRYLFGQFIASYNSITSWANPSLDKITDTFCYKPIQKYVETDLIGDQRIMLQSQEFLGET